MHLIFNALTGRKLVPAVFLHMQKTAGTSIIDVVLPYYGKSTVRYADYRGLSSESLMNVSFVSGHFGYEFAQPLIRSRYSFTFLRDPIDRILSLYYYCRTRDPNQFPIYRWAQELNLTDFLRAGWQQDKLLPYIWNHQTWQLACGWASPSGRRIIEYDEVALLDLAIAHLDEFSQVGFTESFDEDCRTILSDLRIPVPRTIRVGNPTPSRPSLQGISPGDLELLHALTRLDRALYQQAWNRRLARSPGA